MAIRSITRLPLSFAAVARTFKMPLRTLGTMNRCDVAVEHNAPIRSYASSPFKGSGRYDVAVGHNTPIRSYASSSSKGSGHSSGVNLLLFFSGISAAIFGIYEAIIGSKKEKTSLTRVALAEESLGPKDLHSEITELYHLLSKNIETALENAKKTGKPLLILVGEKHKSKKSLIIECIVMRIITEHLPIDRLLVEMDKDGLRLLQFFSNSRSFACKDLNICYLVRTAQSHQMNITACDPAAAMQQKTSKEFVTRQVAMNQEIKKVGENCLLFAGVAHIPLIALADDISDIYEVLAINAAVTRVDTDSIRLSPFEKSLIDMSQNPNVALQLDVSSDLSQVDHETIEQLFSTDFLRNRTPR